MNLKIWILPLLAGGILSSIYLLPQSYEMAPSAIEMALPKQKNGWEFVQRPPSQEEIELLAEDTEFSKATILKARKGEYDSATGRPIPDRIDMSIVLSGHDLNNSIHRPERCMPAQGHQIQNSRRIDLKLPNDETLPVKRLISMQSLPTNEARTEYVHLDCVTYYFFVGHDSITEDHTQRTLIDIKDRLLKGMNQRWAYVSLSMWYGDLPWVEGEIPMEESDRKIQEFIRDFATDQIDWEQIK